MQRAAFVALSGLFLVTLATCTKKATEPEPDFPPDLVDSIDWVGTNVVYDTTVVKKDLSMILFTADWCGWCRKLKYETLSDPVVFAILDESYNCAQIDIDADSQLVYFNDTITVREFVVIYGVIGIPRTVLLDRSGEVIAHIRGHKDADWFADTLDHIRSEATIW